MTKSRGNLSLTSSAAKEFVPISGKRNGRFEAAEPIEAQLTIEDNGNVFLHDVPTILLVLIKELDKSSYSRLVKALLMAP